MTTQTLRVGTAERLVLNFSRFLGGGSFAAFVLCLLFFYEIFVAVMVFAPPATGPLGEFVEQFRMRCFNYNPKAAWTPPLYAWAMLTEPLPLGVAVFFIWRTPLRELWRGRRRALAPAAGTAFVLVVAIALSLLGLGRAQAKIRELPFPADRLRSALPMPAFRFTDQDGQPVSSSDFKGRVVLLTAVYSTCTTTCPMMLQKIREVLDGLAPAQRAGLAVVAFSLNPEADTRELRSMITKAYGVNGVQFHFVNGVPAEMNALLDKLNVGRARDEKTGQLVHSNLFFLLDRAGRIAYRLSLSQREQFWLAEAVRVLLAEPSP